MNQAACTLLLSLLVAAPWGCEAKNTRGSGQIVTTPDGVIIDKYVIDGNTMQVKQKEIGGSDERTDTARSERYLSVHREIDPNLPIRVRVRNSNGGLAVSLDESVDEMLVESVVSIAGRTDQSTKDRLAEVALQVTRNADGWLEVSSLWPGGGMSGGEECVIKVTVPRLEAIDLETTNGSIIAGSCSGKLVAKTMNGNITAMDPRGDIDLRCTNGAIKLQLSVNWSGTVQAQSGNGQINTQTSDDAKVNTNSYQNGRADLQMGTGTKDPRSATLRTENGSIDIQVG